MCDHEDKEAWEFPHEEVAFEILMCQGVDVVVIPIRSRSSQ